MTYDLIVAGLGAWGSAPLYHAARRGLKVLGLDRGSPPHEVSGHRGKGRAIRMASPESPIYTPMMERAYALWHQLEAEYGEPLIAEVGGLYIGQPGSEIIEGSLASFHGTALEHEVLDAGTVRARFPQVAIGIGEQAVWEPGAGVIRPDNCIRAHLQGAKAAGATILTGEALADIVATPQDVTVVSGTGRHVANHLVCCLGAWTPGHLRLDLPIRPERQVAVLWDAKGLGAMPFFVAPAEEAEVVYGLPEAGEAYKAALHHGGRTGDPDSLLSPPTAAEIAAVQRYVEQRLPALRGRRTDAYACLYSNSPDRHFVIGPHPRHRNVTYASGDSGRGYKFASVMGEILARLGAGERVADLELFDPQRFAANATA